MCISWRMMLRVAVVVCCVGAMVPSAPNALAEAPRDDLRRALRELDDWLGHGSVGAGWRAYLHTDQLRQELEKGPAADPEKLAASSQRFHSGAPGLELPRFAAVREALAAWTAGAADWNGDDLPAAVLEARINYVPTSAEDVARAKRHLLAVLARMDRQLAAGGADGEGWARYLLRDRLREQLQTDQPDFDVLSEVQDRFAGPHPGLELPWLREVRDALRAYSDRVAASQNADARQAYESLIDLLAETLNQHNASPTPERRELIAYIVGQFERFSLAPRITRAVRRRYSRPNLFAHASTGVVGAGIARTVGDVAEVRDVILGTRIYGDGHTVGNIYVELVPDPDQAVLDVMLRGTTTSDTVGYNGPVRIYATGKTQVAGRKRLVIDADGVRGLPATAAARTRSHVHGLSTNKHGVVDRLVRRMAWKQVWQKKSRSEYIGSRHAEQRIRDRMNRESSSFIADADRDFHERFLFPLLRHDVFPDLLHFRTTPREVHLVAVQAGAARLAAPSDPPALEADSDLAIRVHESMGNNLAKDLLGGLALTQTRVREIALEVREDSDEPLPDWLIIDEEKGPWSITFEEDNVQFGTRPVTVRFADGGFRVTIHGTNYVVDGLQHDTKMDITAIYQFEETESGWRGVRQGKPLIFPPGFDPDGDQTLSVPETALKSNMENRFDDVFKPEFDMDNFSLPGRWNDAGVFRLVHVESRDGWLALAWRRDAADVPAAITAAKPEIGE